MTGARLLARGVRAGIAGATLAVVLGLPAAVVAGTDPEPTAQPCVSGALPAAAVAGTPLQIRGTSAANGEVGLLARRADGKSVFGSVVSAQDGTWVATLIFDASDGGSWTVELVTGEVRCAGTLTVTLPPGVVAPPTESPEQLPQLGGSTAGPAPQEVAINAAAVLIAGSWLYLVLLRIVRGFTGRPAIRGPLRRITQVAVFVAVLGACLFAWVILAFAVGMTHFFSSIPPDQQAALSVIGVGALVVGSLLGTLAAIRVGAASRAGDDRA